MPFEFLDLSRDDDRHRPLSGLYVRQRNPPLTHPGVNLYLDRWYRCHPGYVADLRADDIFDLRPHRAFDHDLLEVRNAPRIVEEPLARESEKRHGDLLLDPFDAVDKRQVMSLCQ